MACLPDFFLVFPLVISDLAQASVLKRRYNRLNLQYTYTAYTETEYQIVMELPAYTGTYTGTYTDTYT